MPEHDRSIYYPPEDEATVYGGLKPKSEVPITSDLLKLSYVELLDLAHGSTDRTSFYLIGGFKEHFDNSLNDPYLPFYGFGVQSFVRTKDYYVTLIEGVMAEATTYGPSVIMGQIFGPPSYLYFEKYYFDQNSCTPLRGPIIYKFKADANVGWRGHYDFTGTEGQLRQGAAFCELHNAPEEFQKDPSWYGRNRPFRRLAIQATYKPIEKIVEEGRNRFCGGIAYNPTEDPFFRET
ncbi:hypothetical protein M1563_04870 [Patescibacteria group bacterium]|nr:hypothetical protein [Patescibacteria group bacterium]MCL5409465.1 hypothetical protein [Patescibacteria group bacterium]